MKRFHVNVTVADLERSTRFYTTLFGVEPTVSKDDYAKWMLEDPRINFSLRTGTRDQGINHLGLQADSLPELEDIQSRLRQAGATTVDQPDAKCCYAISSKTWVRDPDDVVWESFVTHAESLQYGDDRVPGAFMQAAESNTCCESGAEGPCCI